MTAACDVAVPLHVLWNDEQRHSRRRQRRDPVRRDDGSIGFTNSAMSSAPANFIAPFWDDMDTDTGGTYTEVFGSAPNRVFVVEWNNRPHFSNVGSATFQVLFHETTNKITFQYQDVDFGNVSYNNGASATVGIKGSTIQYSFNAAALSDLLAIQFTPIVPPNIAVSPSSLAATQLPDTTTQQTLTIGNTGGSPLNWTVGESTAANGIVLPLAGSVDYGSPRTAPVQEIKIGDVGLATAGAGVGQQATPQRADTPESLITISHSLSQSIVQYNSVSCNGGTPNFYHTNNSYLRVFDLRCVRHRQYLRRDAGRVRDREGPVSRRGRATAHGQPVCQDRSGQPADLC